MIVKSYNATVVMHMPGDNLEEINTFTMNFFGMTQKMEELNYLYYINI
jgi:hypothetical protein